MLEDYHFYFWVHELFDHFLYLLFCFFIFSMQKFKKIMRATQGALIVASTLQIVLGFSGLWRNVARLVSCF
jgi:hypothetical protein